jgi:GNAT superfamily N-acetyltransferase
MQAETRVREGHAGDAVALSDLVMPLARHLLDAGPGALSGAHPLLATLTAEGFAQRLLSPQYAHYVVEEDKRLCGMIATRDGHHVHHLFVSDATRRRGIARQLWEHALRRHGDRDYTVNSSEIAVPVYERFGFIASGPAQTVRGVRFVPMEWRAR